MDTQLKTLLLIRAARNTSMPLIIIGAVPMVLLLLVFLMISGVITNGRQAVKALLSQSRVLIQRLQIVKFFMAM
jgi:hypothetical protein